ncbi:hypothetical protein IWW50_000015 [Coemansia erecta]|nr:hypothetical protein GGF43_000139 [Coemansia sp. RSA 2618]KAJ2830794.1 hypothetical protein IWW50_000015 [Coemansia erecta]
MESSYPSLLPVLWFLGIWALANLAFALYGRVCKAQHADASRPKTLTAELASPLHLRVTTTAFNAAIESCAQCSLARSPPISWLIDGFYRAGVYVGITSMILCIGVLCAAAMQITAAIGVKAGYALSADAWSPILVLQQLLGSATHQDPGSTPHAVLDSQKLRLGRRLLASTPDSSQVLRPIIPGITLPAGHLWHYMLALAVCAIIHELGHAFAAARARVPLRKLGVFVMGIYPGAFVELCKDKLDQSPVGSRLRIVYAGVWHNAVTALVVWVLVRSGSLSAVFSHTGWTRVMDGVVVADIVPHSPLYSRIPLLSTVHRIDDVYLQPLGASNHSNAWNSTSEERFGATAIARWTSVLTATASNRDTTTSGYCVSTDENADDGLCCEMSPQFPLGESPDSAIFCFERFAAPARHGPATGRRLPMCFDLRSILERGSAADRCQSDQDCSKSDQHSRFYPGGRKSSRLCVLPSAPFASSRVLRLYYRPPGSQTEQMLVYAGLPTELWLDVQVSSLLPRHAWLPHSLPSWFETLLQYVLSFSLAFCLLNALPAWYLDGDIALRLLITALEQRRKTKPPRLVLASKCNIIASAASKPSSYKRASRPASTGRSPPAADHEPAQGELSRGGQLLYTAVTTSTTVLLIWCIAGSVLLLAL